MQRANRRSRSPLVTAAVLAVVLAGCGSDRSGGGDAAPTGSDVASVSDATGNYLSLGDSYAQGFQPGDRGDEGYVGFADLLPAAARAKGYDLDLVNLGCGGATVASMAESAGCTGVGRVPDGPVYDASQLDAAVDYLEGHPGQVELITVSIGGNDILGCTGEPDPVPCVTEAVDRIDPALDQTLGRLRLAAGTDTVIIGLTYPDVILGSYLTGGDGAARTAAASVVAFRDVVNPTLRERYEAVDGIFVDLTEATGAYRDLAETTTLAPFGEIPVAVAEVCRLTWVCEQGDIHPNDAGYREITDEVTAALPTRP